MLLYLNGPNQYHFPIASTNVFPKIPNNTLYQSRNVAYLYRKKMCIFSNSNHMKAGLKLLSFSISITLYDIPVLYSTI